MKKIASLILVCIYQFGYVFSQGVGINEAGAAPDASAILDASSTNKGQLLPRMTTTQRDNISNPATGLMIYNTTNDCVQFYAQGQWFSLGCANCANPPSVTAQPSDENISAGDNTSFSVTATGDGLTYQWQEDPNTGTFANITNGGTNPVYAGATTASLSLNNVPAGHDQYKYRCIVSGSCTPAATSNSATLTVVSCPTWSDDFTSYGTQPAMDAAWPTTDNVRMLGNITTDNIDFNAIRDNTNDAIAYDLGAGNVSDTQWILRYKIRFSALNNGAGNELYIGLSDSDQNTSEGSAQDGIFMVHVFYNVNNQRAEHGDGTSISILDNFSSWTASTNTDYYVEMIRSSATDYSISLYTNSDYSTGLQFTLDGTGTIAATLQNLRYIKIMNEFAVSGAGNQAGTIDDVQFCNGTTTW